MIALAASSAVTRATARTAWESYGMPHHSVSCCTASVRASRAPRLVLLRRSVNSDVMAVCCVTAPSCKGGSGADQG